MTVTIHKPTPAEIKKYRTILADPPWPESGGGKIKRGADRHYPLMTVKEIIALGAFVQSIAEDASHLYLWVTNNFLEHGFAVAKAWGFKYVTCLTWEKLGKVGLGQFFRGRTEQVLFCNRGSTEYKINPLTNKRAQGETSFKSIDVDFALWLEGCYFEALRQTGSDGEVQHSKKPIKIHEWAEIVSHGPYLEMFQVGPQRPGWDRWGNGIWEKSLTSEIVW